MIQTMDYNWVESKNRLAISWVNEYTKGTGLIKPSQEKYGRKYVCIEEYDWIPLNMYEVSIWSLKTGSSPRC